MAASPLKKSTVIAGLLAVCLSSGATTIRKKDVASDILIQRLQLSPASNRARHDQLTKLFIQSGCDPTDLKVTFEEPNIRCVLPGETDNVILIGAHFDKVARGHGVVDNWSGASLLPSLFESLSTVKRHHTFVFIGFTAEEEGLVGSRNYVHHLSKQERAQIHAMIAMDTLGITPTKVWSSHSDKTLLYYLVNVSQSLNLPISGMNVDYVGDTDSSPFRDAKIPTVTFHSITTETWHILHSDKDDIKAIDQKAYLDSCRLIAAYVAYLDEVLDNPSLPSPSLK